jgi:SAM-dependent methyltransferase
MFFPVPRELGFLQLQEGSVVHWEPNARFDLITCVHGLHYVGDKLRVIERATSWLKPDGLFLAHLDLTNLRLADGKNAGRKVLRDLRYSGLEYDSRKHLLSCRGRKDIRVDYAYLGAEDRAGPNYTRQEAVNSYYRCLKGE